MTKAYANYTALSRATREASQEIARTRKILRETMSAPTQCRVTEWFDGKRYVPGAPGFYEREIAHLFKINASYWNGEYWCVDHFFNAPFRGSHVLEASPYQDIPFRGLAAQHQEK